VNKKNAVKIISGLSICFVLLGCATKSAVIDQGNGTYSITRTGGNVFDRDTEAMAAQAKEDAAHACAAQGKQLKVLDVVIDKPFYTTGYASAKVVYKPVTQEELDAPPPVAAYRTMAPAESPRTQATDDLYAQLTKLDELRKKGILTDEEFQAEKKKILSHFN
jgi:hypothetical protein